MLATACTSAGLWSAWEVKKHLDELYRVQKIIQKIISEMNYHYKDLGQILEHIGDQEGKPYQEWLGSISNRMKDKKGIRFEQMWRESIEEKLGRGNSRLTKEERYQLQSVGNAFGQVDGKLQLQIFHQFLQQWEEEIRIQRTEIAGKQKLRRTLGVTSGIFLVILLM